RVPGVVLEDEVLAQVREARPRLCQLRADPFRGGRFLRAGGRGTAGDGQAQGGRERRLQEAPAAIAHRPGSYVARARAWHDPRRREEAMEDDGFVFEPDLAAASTIPARWYLDPDVLEREQDRVFARTWQLVGSAGQVARPG